MTQALLVTATAAKARMAIASDVLGLDPAVESAIKASQLRVEAELDSKLDKQSYSDVFHLDPEYFADVTPGGLLRLQLRTGLVRAAPELAIFTGRTWDSCTDPADTTKLKVDPIRGIVYLDRPTFQGLYCRVDYDAGFDANEALPDWLSEAILAYIPVVWNLGQPSNRSPEAENQARLSGDHAMAMLARYHRNIGFTFRPVY